MPTMERIGDTVSATTPIERLAAGLAILAAHDARDMADAVTIDGATKLLVSSFTPVDAPTGERLRALGWADYLGRWTFPL